MADTSNWQKIAEHPNELNFAENNIAVVTSGGKKFCVARFHDQYFAFAYQCPHAGALMADGFIDAFGNVACPIHRYKFDMKNGRNVTGEGFHLRHWPVEWREDGVFVLLS
jgi:nitrite reductase/ring-hydroxylating ferredoxin subunit